uniref:Uncharacterized protein n=1 Tax=Chromera velia CCMP2878 TaxID=1169474 RepID=A0A0G4FYC0_9ALVE|eukprot:Cvel_19285.t1-p1 / transcript=Cvel_19285.t1 / gene=Cvel_19285 / organism=Chromera_velia_CCMP2878 / gene_product=hypothetical protein / transcript_product=hypothetical protein / location=Cvel_scaffold1651:17664-17879(+) / protein_length=72 / sequence_SO=supercontig / SO=protein_coding / is_pseudo=false
MSPTVGNRGNNKGNVIGMTMGHSLSDGASEKYSLTSLEIPPVESYGPSRVDPLACLEDSSNCYTPEFVTFSS